jgi:membrane associated rhomboid family serine protease
VFPLKDENPTSRVTWMTWLLVAANVAVFAWEIYLLASGRTPALDAFVTAWSFDPAHLLAAPFSPAVWLTVLTAMFLHAGWIHIGGNMLYLWIFGNNIEDRIGPWRFLGFYLVCGIVATIAQSVASGFANVPTLGASGAIAGVLGAYVLLYPRAKVLTAIFVIFIIELALIPAWVVILVWFGLQLAAGIATVGPASASGGVAYFAHIGGFVAGIVLILPAWIADRSKGGFVAWR